jgi:hypothetical protein
VKVKFENNSNFMTSGTGTAEDFLYLRALFFLRKVRLSGMSSAGSLAVH